MAEVTADLCCAFDSMSRLVQEARARADGERAAVTEAVREAEQRREREIRGELEDAAASKIAELEKEHGMYATV